MKHNPVSYMNIIKPQRSRNQNKNNGKIKKGLIFNVNRPIRQEISTAYGEIKKKRD